MAAARARGAPHEVAATLVAEAQVGAASGRHTQAADLLRQAIAEFVRLDMPWHAATARQVLPSAHS
jgi:hypothetical protein